MLKRIRKLMIISALFFIIAFVLYYFSSNRFYISIVVGQPTPKSTPTPTSTPTLFPTFTLTPTKKIFPKTSSPTPFKNSNVTNITQNNNFDISYTRNTQINFNSSPLAGSTQNTPAPTAGSDIINPTMVPSPGNSYTYLTVDKTNVNATLSRANSQGGLIYGPGFTIKSQGATGFSLYNLSSTQGQGFYESSGGMANQSSVNIRTYINANKPNGSYTGSVMVKYQKNGVWYDSGIVVSYTIILTD